jgi:hypothetical protein
VGIEENNIFEFTANVYPNPLNATSMISINSATPASYKISLFDAVGKQVGDEIQIKNTTQYTSQINDFSNDLSSGIYFLQIISGDTKQILKIIR